MPDAKQATLPFPVHYEKPPLWLRVAAWFLRPWIDISREPLVPPFQVDRPVCYVLENYGLTNLLILDRACRDAGLPSPLASLPGNPLGRKRSYFALSRRGGSSGINAAKNKRHSDALSRVIMAHRLYPEQDVQLVPVSIFVGRAPTRQSGWFSVLSPITVAATSMIVGRKMAGIGYKKLLVTGPMIMSSTVVGSVLFLHVEPTPWFPFLPLMFFLGIGLGATFPAQSAVTILRLPPHRFALGGAINNTFRQVGSAIGVALVVTVQSQTKGIEGFRNGWKVAICFALLSACVSLS